MTAQLAGKSSFDLLLSPRALYEGVNRDIHVSLTVTCTSGVTWLFAFRLVSPLAATVVPVPGETYMDGGSACISTDFCEGSMRRKCSISFTRPVN